MSENFSIRNASGLSCGFNEGGGVRGSETYSISDIIGGSLNGNLVSSPTLTVAPDTVNFDNAVVGSPSSVTLVMQNEGVDNIVIGTITITGNDVIEFALQNDNCSNRILSPFIACTIQAVLTPKSNGAKGAVVTIPYNDSEVKYKTVSMAGIVILDAVPPDTVITMKPLNPSNESWATFNFTSTELNSTLECKIDGDDFTACTNPAGYVYLADGDHTFSVRATDAAGNTDLSPASYTWTIDTAKPSSAITLPVNGATIIGSTWTIPAEGIYTIKTRAADNAGNVEIPGSGITITAYTQYSFSVSGSGYNYPQPGFRASLSMNINGSSLETSWLTYYYAKLRLNLVSTSITGISILGNIVAITGTGTVNGIAGYTFIITIVDGNPDTIEIVIYNPDGTIYFQSGLEALSSGDFNVTAYICSSSVRILESTPLYYSTLQEAYDAAIDGDIIQSQAAGFTEDINIDRNITVSLEGGYSCDYSARTGKTTLNGMITINDGVITIEDFELQ